MEGTLAVALEGRIRAIEPGDVDAVLAIQEASPEAARWTAHDYQHACEKLFYVIVAGIQGAVAGFLVARAVHDELEILNMAVRPADRRRGIATLLLSEALSFGCSRGARRAFLEVRASNHAAIAFYKRLGFTPAGGRPNYYIEPVEDALVLARQLAPNSL